MSAKNCKTQSIPRVSAEMGHYCAQTPLHPAIDTKPQITGFDDMRVQKVIFYEQVDANRRRPPGRNPCGDRQ